MELTLRPLLVIPMCCPNGAFWNTKLQPYRTDPQLRVMMLFPHRQSIVLLCRVKTKRKDQNTYCSFWSRNGASPSTHHHGPPVEPGGRTLTKTHDPPRFEKGISVILSNSESDRENPCLQAAVRKPRSVLTMRERSASGGFVQSLEL